MPAALAELTKPGVSPFRKCKREYSCQDDKRIAIEHWISLHGKEPSLAIGLQACQISWDNDTHIYEAGSPWWRWGHFQGYGAFYELKIPMLMKLGLADVHCVSLCGYMSLLLHACGAFLSQDSIYEFSQKLAIRRLDTGSICTTVPWNYTIATEEWPSKRTYNNTAKDLKKKKCCLIAWG